MRVAVPVDRDAFDVLHREEREAVVGQPAVEEASDARMIQRRQHLPLLAEAADDARIQVHTASHELERDALVELAVVSLREVDGAHPTFADQPLDAVGADALRCRDDRYDVVRHERSAEPGGGRVEHGVGALSGLEDRRHLAEKVGFARALPLEIRLALGRRQVEGRVEQRLDPAPPFRIGHADPGRSTASPSP